MWQEAKRGVLFFVFVAILLLSNAGAIWAQPSFVTRSGALPDGATFLVEMPANCNGTLFLYRHGYVVPGAANPAQDFAINDPATRFFMLASGFALAGSSYATTGWRGGMVPVAPAFVEFHPNQYLRPFDAGDKDRDDD
jgi:hypothetical protein